MNTADNKKEISEHFINLESIIKNKNPRLFSLLPSFIFNFLKKIIHLEEINGIIYRNREQHGLGFVDAILKDFGVNIIVTNENNIPETGRYLLVANHPLGGLDGLAFIDAVGKKRKDIMFPVNDLLLNLPNFDNLFIPINKHGLNTRNIDKIEETFASDSLVLYFPAGICSRKKNGIIRDLIWHKTFVSKARKHKRDIIPVYIQGRNSDFFYNMSYLRNFLKIKSNVEMVLLPHEMFSQKGKTIHLKFGEPISYKHLDNSLTDKQWAEKIKTIVYNLNN